MLEIAKPAPDSPASWPRSRGGTLQTFAEVILHAKMSSARSLAAVFCLLFVGAGPAAAQQQVGYNPASTSFRAHLAGVNTIMNA
jgi:hypothetical protein